MNWIPLGIVGFGLLLIWDSLNYGETLGWFWCLIGRHQYYDIHGAAPFKDFYEPINHCRLCAKSKPGVELSDEWNDERDGEWEAEETPRPVLTLIKGKKK
jgi:hypothetical protein